MSELYGEWRLDEAQRDAAEVQAWLDKYGDEEVVAIRVINVFGKGRDVLRQMWRSLPNGVSDFSGVIVACGSVEFGVRCSACAGVGMVQMSVAGSEEGETSLEDCPVCGGAGWSDITSNKEV